MCRLLAVYRVFSLDSRCSFILKRCLPADQDHNIGNEAPSNEAGSLIVHIAVIHHQMLMELVRFEFLIDTKENKNNNNARSIRRNVTTIVKNYGFIPHLSGEYARMFHYKIVINAAHMPGVHTLFFQLLTNWATNITGTDKHGSFCKSSTRHSATAK